MKERSEGDGLLRKKVEGECVSGCKGGRGTVWGVSKWGLEGGREGVEARGK